MAKLVIVESPSKATTIQGYLGSGYKVVASKGHIRDLPKSSLGVDIEHHFEPHYINIRGKGDVIKQLKKDAKDADVILLATDPDREGEAISWHLASTLGIPLDKRCRITFNENTKGAIKEAIKAPRAIDEDLVNSQQARRILDRIVGYKLSPFLWKNVKSGLSAGRVQSVATRVIVEREQEIRAFVPQEYWTIQAQFRTPSGETFTADFVGEGDEKIRISDEKQAREIVEAVQGQPATVRQVRKALKYRQPAPPYTTSTLQQDAAKKLGFQSQRTMKVAQELYEGVDVGAEFGGVQGLISYMRTDSLRISQVAQSAALELVGADFGESYLPKTPRVYKAKANAQDAHEAIRPADVRLRPKQIRKYLSPDQYRLYKLIWEHFVASQMAAAAFNTVTVELTCGKYLFHTAGASLKFPVYLAVYEKKSNAGANDDDDDDEYAEGNVPDLTEGDALQLTGVDPEQHFTQAPPRYNEASLIKMLEESGIGRPSTFATIITTIINRSYVKREGKAFVPTPLGEVTTELMKKKFPKIIDYEFTAQMEDKLDSIEQGGCTMEQVLEDFYEDFEKALEAADATVSRDDIDIPPEVSEYPCDKCGSMMVYKNGRFGRFLACPNYPACKNTKAINKDGSPVEKQEQQPEIADFKCELCGGDMVLRHGKYGSFYACVNYPTCKFTKQKTVDTGVKCPKCGARIVTKFGRGKRMFYSCERYPDCDFSSWDMPLPEQCPQCGDILYYKKGKKTVYCKRQGCGYKREEEHATPEL